MTGEQGFLLHPDAAEDILEIWQFIAADDPAAATRFRETILESIRKLVNFPHQGHRRRDLTSAPLRFQTVRDYLIAYASDEKPVVVVAVIHGRRNPRVLAATLRARE
jgi:toxin ParE1/3/4